MHGVVPGTKLKKCIFVLILSRISFYNYGISSPGNWILLGATKRNKKGFYKLWCCALPNGFKILSDVDITDVLITSFRISSVSLPDIKAVV